MLKLTPFGSDTPAVIQNGRRNDYFHECSSSGYTKIVWTRSSAGGDGS